MSKQIEALKLAMEVGFSVHEGIITGGVTDLERFAERVREYLRKPAQQEPEPVAFSQFLSDVVTAAGLLSHGKTDKSLAARISEFAFRLRTSPPASKPWVGLSTIELDEIDAPIRERGHATIAEIYRAIEAKLREKNA